MICETVEELAPVIGTRPACRALGACVATVYRHRRPSEPRPARPRPTSARALSEPERARVLKVLHSERFVDVSPEETYATLLDEGTYLCSTRTMYRLLEARHGAVRERRDQLTHPAYAKPELLAKQPNELWSWDISKLKGPAKWTWFYLYAILDVFSRYVVGWTVQYRETAQVAKAMIEQATEQQHIGRDVLTVHADRGGPMRSKPVAFLLRDLGAPRRTAGRTPRPTALQRSRLRDAQVPARVPGAVRRHRPRPRSPPVVLRLVQPPAPPLRDRVDDTGRRPLLTRAAAAGWTRPRAQRRVRGALRTVRAQTSRATSASSLRRS